MKSNTIIEILYKLEDHDRKKTAYSMTKVCDKSLLQKSTRNKSNIPPKYKH